MARQRTIRLLFSFDRSASFHRLRVGNPSGCDFYSRPSVKLICTQRNLIKSTENQIVFIIFRFWVDIIRFRIDFSVCAESGHHGIGRLGFIAPSSGKPFGLFTKKAMQTPPPLRNDPHQKMIANGAQCSESNENMNKKFFRFLFFELSSKIGVIFSEK